MNPSHAYGGRGSSNYDPSFSGGGYNPNSNNYYAGASGAYAGGATLYDESYGNNYNTTGQDDAEGYFTLVNGQYVPNHPMDGALADTAYEEEAVEPGTYYLTAQWSSAILEGAPVSALAYDTAYEALFLATDTFSSSSSSSGGRHSGTPRSARLVTHAPSDGMLYAAVAGHPEAPAPVLQTVYRALYGATDATVATRTTIPHHAYTPPYGRSDPALLHVPVVTPYIGGSGGPTHPPNYQMGITTLWPLSGGGTLASVSPAGVRLHTMGGMPLADVSSLEGMLAASWHPHSPQTHLLVGGVALAGKDQLHCLDLWQGLRIVSSHALDRTVRDIGITAMATSVSRGCTAVGATDGFLRLVDPRGRALAKIKSHPGGVVAVAVSDDGTLVATTGYGSATALRHPTTPPYGFPDPLVLVNDIRYLGRGGFPHSFQGLRGGPRHVAFLPDVAVDAHGEGGSPRLLVASGQVGGGCQVLRPFQPDDDAPSFLVPPLQREEAIGALAVADEKLALGTNQGNVLQYQMAGYAKTKPGESILGGGLFVPPSPSLTSAASTALAADEHRSEAVVEKMPLVLPPFEPPLPALSLDASMLLLRNERGLNDRVRSVFGSYILTAEPVVSAIGEDPRSPGLSSFGPLATHPLVGQCRLQVAPSMIQQARRPEDPLHTVVVSDLNVNLMDDHRIGSRSNKHASNNKPLANPNKLIYDKKMYDLVYTESLNRSKRYERQSRRYGKSSNQPVGAENDALLNIPKQYRLMLRPMHLSAASYNHAEYNQSALIPGFDYPFTMTNSFVPPILLLLYFVPELRDAANKAQWASVLSSSKDQTLLTELGFLFHRIESLSRYAYIFPANEGPNMPLNRVGAWAPLSFLSSLMTLTEAERNQILDDSPAAVDPPRRPEAFYRFLLYQLDTETSHGRSGGKVDALAGIDFCSINEFISGSGPPSRTMTRHLTVELSYDSFFGPDDKILLLGKEDDEKHYFGDVLQFNLCRASRLRAWSAASKSYETIVQHKIATSLPTLLSLSAACAGRKGEKGISLWQSNKGWLPEIMEIEIDENGSVIVRELLYDETLAPDSWKECRGSGSIPSSVAEILKEYTSSGAVRKRRYRLEAVLSMVRDDMDRSCPEELRSWEADGGYLGHQVLHVRVNHALQCHLVEEQRTAIQSYVDSWNAPKENDFIDLTLAGRDADRTLFHKRLQDAEARCAALPTDPCDRWIAVNGFVVSNSDVHDARAFDFPFKEPLLMTYRAIEEEPPLVPPKTLTRPTISPDVLRTSSLTNGSKSPYYRAPPRSAAAATGDLLLALDAEFVAVADEVSLWTSAGTKFRLREPRHALARLSLLDGSGGVVLDDHVRPLEPVRDCLTRFSGIVAADLHPKLSRHHLVAPRAAYWKLRYWIEERQSVFVGHGLWQDFWTANVHVPDHQMIDTLDIYHKPAQRYISLRFLVNFVLQHDVQQDVHDSVEDAMSALELYRRALEHKRNGTWEQLLDDLYAYGQKNDWKLGLDDADE